MDKNKHPRDKNLYFDEKRHLYYINNKKTILKSCTNWCKSHFPKFDKDKVIDAILKNPSQKYAGMNKSDIEKMWKKNIDDGIKLHSQIENHYLGKEVCNDSQFKLFEEWKPENWKPYRMEWKIYDEKIGVAGCVDAVFRIDDTEQLKDSPNELSNAGDSLREFVLVDWKRCNDIRQDNPFESAITECIKDIPNCNYWHYTLQLNMYKYILENNYDMKIKEMYIVCLHPDNYKIYKIENFDRFNSLLNV